MWNLTNWLKLTDDDDGRLLIACDWFYRVIELKICLSVAMNEGQLAARGQLQGVAKNLQSSTNIHTSPTHIMIPSFHKCAKFSTYFKFFHCIQEWALLTSKYKNKQSIFFWTFWVAPKTPVTSRHNSTQANVKWLQLYDDSFWVVVHP